MTHEEFTSVTFSDPDLSGIRISRSSEFSVVNSTEIALNIGLPHKAHSLFYEPGDYRQANTLC